MRIEGLPDWIRPKIVETDEYFDGSPCWRYTGKATTGDGYSRVKRKGKGYLVHRLVFELLVGPIGYGLVCGHLCRRRWCCSPHYLRDVSVKENTLAGEGVKFMFSPVERDLDYSLWRRALNLEIDGNEGC